MAARGSIDIGVLASAIHGGRTRLNHVEGSPRWGRRIGITSVKAITIYSWNAKVRGAAALVAGRQQGPVGAQCGWSCCGPGVAGGAGADRNDR